MFDTRTWYDRVTVHQDTASGYWFALSDESNAPVYTARNYWRVVWHLLWSWR